MIVSQSTLQGLRTGKLSTKFNDGRYYVPVNIEVEKGRMLFQFGYNPGLQALIKESMEGRKYHGYIDGDGRKLWSAPITQRNLFRLEVLQGKYGSNPYGNWEVKTDYRDKILDYCVKRHHPLTPYAHQVDMVNLALNGHWVLWAAEMGTGKSLSGIMLLEIIQAWYGLKDFVWVGPKSALVSAKLEFRNWQSRLAPAFMTYDGLKKLVENWPKGQPAPQGVILDESSRCKTAEAQRTQAAQHLANSMRSDHGWDKSYIALLSGTPAPKVPTDWHAQVEIAYPGFLRESNMAL